MNQILVVEDSANERVGLCRLLERSGYQVQAAGDGKSALELLGQRHFDVLLADVWLPGMTGLELLARLPKQSRPKCLVITGDDAEETTLAALREHAYRCIAKPVDPAELMETIKAALESADPEDSVQVLSADPHWVELRFSCNLETASRIQDYVHRLDSRLPENVRQSAELAFHEVLMNAVEWGGHLDPRAKVQITCLRTDQLLLYRIADPGKGFDLSRLEHAAVGHQMGRPDAHIQARETKGIRPGGYGILMAQSLVDEMVYNEAHNEVVLLKYLKGTKH